MVRRNRTIDVVLKAIDRGHFKLASGNHTDRVLRIEDIRNHLGALSFFVAEEFRYLGIEVVLGPATGGNILSLGVSVALGGLSRQNIIRLETKKAVNEATGEVDFIINRPHCLKNRRVLVVEDVLTTGNSVRKLINRVYEAEGRIIGVGALFNRRGVKLPGLTKFFSFLDLPLEDWKPKSCYLCKQGIPLS